MNLATVITFIGLLITSYSVFRSGRATLIETFISRLLVLGGLSASALVLAFPLIVLVHDGTVPPGLDAGAQLFSFLLLATVVAYIFLTVSESRLRRRSARRLERCAPAAVVNSDWPGLLTILRRNKSSVTGLVNDETIGWLFDSRFVRAMANAGEWIHLEVLAEEDPAARGRVWRFRTTDVVGRAMLDEEGTLLQKALASPFSSHETLRPTEAEKALLERTYWNPRWYMALRADYPLVLRAVEVLQSGRLDEGYNAATWTYTGRQGITTRWNCPVWVAAKTISVAIDKAIEGNVNGDEYASDLLDILREVVERSEFNQATWGNPRANWEYPTPFAFLIYEILHDLGDLWEKTAKRGLFSSPPVTRPADAPRCELISRLWAYAVSMVAREKSAGSDRFRIDLVRSYLHAVLEVGFFPYELFHQDPEVNPGVLDTFRDLLLDQLLRAVKGDAEGVRIVCQVAATLDRGRRWVTLGGDWLDALLARALDCPRRIEGGAPPASPPPAAL